MKRFISLLILFLTISIALLSCSNQIKPKKNVQQITKHNKTNMDMNHNKDKRISLNLNPQMRQHQLMNMRNHLKAVKSIINLISKNQFKKASELAHKKLGLTEEMKKMCMSFNNKDFTRMGLEFHKSADKLGDILSTKDKNKSLQALSNTMSFCVNCHATFRQ